MFELKDGSWVESGMFFSALILDCVLSWNAGFKVPPVTVDDDVNDDDDALLIQYSSDDIDTDVDAFSFSFSFAVSFGLLEVLRSGLCLGRLCWSSFMSMNI